MAEGMRNERARMEGRFLEKIGEGLRPSKFLLSSSFVNLLEWIWAEISKQTTLSKEKDYISHFLSFVENAHGSSFLDNAMITRFFHKR